MKILTVIVRQGADESAFNHVLMRKEASFMDTCELFDIRLLFFSAQ